MTKSELVTQACCQLWHTDAEMRQRAAAKLAQFDDRSALRHLDVALTRESDEGTRVAIRGAIETLTK